MAGAVPRHAQPSLPRATMGKPDGSALNPPDGPGAGRADPGRRARCPRLGKGVGEITPALWPGKLDAGMGLPLPAQR